ncbi:biliverdin-producing heme oxygenase [Amycolatopsis sp. SID8362]|uniref:biliverdin-producing heme oxygenase n=1 Tax=Amycolatopsis sp. SID8362 TaxID=2690346 RepID=UPI0013717A29|nr:biliverdin-producing heme oxygenase [Amycolatopsis sp. SID8362]NBH10048.1 biliverdin-producing heme oxygenase [Amycolatopsis sp. SID8362]NED46742.1 biliverdin-producing heme oxygenase [Amycolatopsis sp. SID8362]
MSVTTDARPFSATLRASTLEVHEKANYSTYMRALLGGELSQAGYTQLAIQYYFVYSAIEAASDTMAGHPVGGEFVFDELRRLPNLERDLAHLVGPDWRTTIAPLASTQAYVERVREASTWAGGYVAHHYTRYLGDIAGGQAIRRVLERQYDVAEAGALFYHFDEIGSAPRFRDQYRAKLDNAPWDEAERARVIDETLVAFECNVAVFDELAGRLDEYRVA